MTRDPLPLVVLCLLVLLACFGRSTVGFLAVMGLLVIPVFSIARGKR